MVSATTPTSSASASPGMRYWGPEMVENVVPATRPSVALPSEEEVTCRTRVAETEHERRCPSFVVEMVPTYVHATAIVPVAGVELVAVTSTAPLICAYVSAQS